MNKIKKILIPTDFSEVAHGAIDYALNFRQSHSELEMTLLHVTQFPILLDAKDNLVKSLEQKVKELSDLHGVSCNYILESGDLTETILDVQRRKEIDLIVTGTLGSDKIETSKTSELVIEADCPVLVIPKKTDSFSIKNIALALDENDIDDSYVLGILHDIARSFDADIHVITISKEGNGVIKEDTNESILEYYLETLDYRHVFPKNSDIEKGIENYVNDKNIDMLVTLPRNHAKKSTPSKGRLTKLLALHTKVPLLALD